MENVSIKKIVDDFLRQRREEFLEKMFNALVKNLGDKINKSSEAQEVKERAQRIIATKKVKEQSALDSIKEKYSNLSSLNFHDVSLLDETKSNASINMNEIERKCDPVLWLNYVSENASEVNLEITHVAKLIHSSAKSSNINANIHNSKVIKPILITGNFQCIDYAYSNAEFSPVAEFLQLDCGGELLGKVICKNPSLLKCFAKDDEQLEQWQKKISLAFNDRLKSSHILAKQVYFPTSRDYHLLLPLISSSMAQVIYDRIWQTRKKDTPARLARKVEIFSEEIDILFHKTAILKVTQTNHQNVSSLNGKRSGELILFPSQPPQWKFQVKPPIDVATIFNKRLSYQAEEFFIKLQNLLLAIKFNKLSVNLQRKQLIAALIIDIAGVVFDYVRQIHMLKQHAGWSQHSKLRVHQQYWLDPFRADEEFQAARASIDWQTDIVNYFSKWVNVELKHNQLTLGLSQEKQWQKIFLPLLEEFNSLTEEPSGEDSLEEAI